MLEVIREQDACFRNHAGHMDYAANAALGGVPIGSRSVESLCSQFQNRLKRTGQFWTKQGFAALLRIVVQNWNGELNSLWLASAAWAKSVKRGCARPQPITEIAVAIA